MAWATLPAVYEDAAANLLAACAQLGSPEQALSAISAMRGDGGGEVLAWIEDETLVAVYGLRKNGPSYVMPWLAVDPAWRGKRYGRSALTDALRRCGRSPMTVEADDGHVGWFQRVGFKIVGRKPQPDGGYRYRLGWYAPRRPDEPGYGAHG
jgi:ribosomal protein S18 acetylase RimI-like enzyme